MLSNRAEKRGVRTAAIIRDIIKILGPKIFWLGLTIAVGVLAWYRTSNLLQPLLERIGISLPAWN